VPVKKESIESVRAMLIEKILNANIDEDDKIELAINIMTFLDNYDEDLRALQEQQHNKFIPKR